MHLVSTYVSVSKIEGVGLFAGEDIPAGTVMWRFTPEWCKTFPVDEIDSLPAPVRKMVLHYGWIDVLRPERGFILDLSDARFENHSFDPNNRFDMADRTIAMRDIQKGEEITIDYTTFFSPNDYQSAWLKTLKSKRG